MNKDRLTAIAFNALKAIAATAAIGMVQEGLKHVDTGDRKIVLFTARK